MVLFLRQTKKPPKRQGNLHKFLLVFRRLSADCKFRQTYVHFPVFSCTKNGDIYARLPPVQSVAKYIYRQIFYRCTNLINMLYCPYNWWNPRFLRVSAKNLTVPQRRPNLWLRSTSPSPTPCGRRLKAACTAASSCFQQNSSSASGFKSAGRPSDGLCRCWSMRGSSPADRAAAPTYGSARSRRRF